MKKAMMMIAAVVALSLSANVFAQDRPAPERGERGSGWMEKMKAARVAFLTNEQEERDAAYKETREAYRALTDAIKADKGDKEVSALLKAYLKASKVPAQLDEEYLPEFLKVLPATKVAKLYISEEKFRKMQFQNMQGPRGEGGAGVHEGGRPGGREGGFRGPGQGGRPGGREGGFRGPGFGRQSENTNE